MRCLHVGWLSAHARPPEDWLRHEGQPCALSCRQNTKTSWYSKGTIHRHFPPHWQWQTNRLPPLLPSVHIWTTSAYSRCQSRASQDFLGHKQVSEVDCGFCASCAQLIADCDQIPGTAGKLVFICLQAWAVCTGVHGMLGSEQVQSLANLSCHLLGFICLQRLWRVRL